MVTLHRYTHPNDLMTIINVLKEYPNSTTKEIREIAEDMGYFIHDKKRFEDSLTLAKDLNLVSAYKKRYTLTEDGEAVYTILYRKPDLFVDLIHGLIIIGDSGFSWAYREVCKLLWTRGHINEIKTREIASEIITKAREVFGDSVSFSPKSVNGVLHWLSELRPSVIMNDKSSSRKSFRRRSFCPPELLILAIDRLYSQHSRNYGSNVLLTEEVLNELCCTCLLEMNALDRVLRYAVNQFDFVESGVGGGWGRYIALHRKPELGDFI